MSKLQSLPTILKYTLVSFRLDLWIMGYKGTLTISFSFWWFLPIIWLLFRGYTASLSFIIHRACDEKCNEGPFFQQQAMKKPPRSDDQLTRFVEVVVFIFTEVSLFQDKLANGKCDFIIGILICHFISWIYLRR